MKPSYRPFSALMLLICLILTSGCGVKLVYNNADRLARWWVDDYIDMTPGQRKYFDASVADIMYWHRTSQLPIYSEGLRELAASLEASDLELAELVAVADEVESWGVAFNARAVPVAVDILLSLSPEQLEDFDRAMVKSNKEYLREAKRDPESRAKREAKDYSSLMRRFIGRLSREQKALVVEQHLAMAPDAQAIVDYRMAWQRKLLAALSASPPQAELLSDLMMNFDDHYTPEFATMIEQNEVVYQNLTIELLRSLSVSQRQRLIAQLREYAEIFDELISEAAPGAPPLPKPISARPI